MKCTFPLSALLPHNHYYCIDRPFTPSCLCHVVFLCLLMFTVLCMYTFSKCLSLCLFRLLIVKVCCLSTTLFNSYGPSVHMHPNDVCLWAESFQTAKLWTIAAHFLGAIKMCDCDVGPFCHLLLALYLFIFDLFFALLIDTLPIYLLTMLVFFCCSCFVVSLFSCSHAASFTLSFCGLWPALFCKPLCGIVLLFLIFLVFLHCE